MSFNNESLAVADEEIDFTSGDDLSRDEESTGGGSFASGVVAAEGDTVTFRDLVDLIEQSIVDLLAGMDIEAAPRRDAPGVYVDGAKIAALGLRVRRGCSYHGLALNVDLDLEPFSRINPCGHEGLAVTSMRRCLGRPVDMQAVGESLLEAVVEKLDAVTAA